MTRDELLVRLRECAANGDIEGAHGDADKALLQYIGDVEITEAWLSVEKWYA